MISNGYHTDAVAKPVAHTDASDQAQAVILNIVLALAVLSAIAGCLTRNWTAGALLASFAFSMALCRSGVPFNFVLWVVIDLVVILFVIRKDMSRRDLTIIALFAPAWTLYLFQPLMWSQAVAALVAAQMLLTFPDRKAAALAKQVVARFRQDDNSMKLVPA